MASYEIDNFVNKFKAFCQGGRTDSLTLSSKAGKALVNLRVDLGPLSQQDQHQHHPPKYSRNGPAQQRRSERRAAARQAAAVEAETILSVEEKEVLNLADIAKHNLDAEKAEDAPEGITIIEVVKTSVEEVEDKVVPDSEYELKTPSKDDSKTASKPKEEPPPPIRDRTLGGIEYYRLRYDDPIFDKGYYEFVGQLYTFQYRKLVFF